MFNFFKSTKKRNVGPGKFWSLLQVIDNTSRMTATPGKLIPGEKSEDSKEYEIFLQDEPKWWTVAAGNLLSEDFFPLENQQKYLVGSGVSEIGCVVTGQKFQMMTSKGYKTFSVGVNGKISQAK